MKVSLIFYDFCCYISFSCFLKTVLPVYVEAVLRSRSIFIQFPLQLVKISPTAPTISTYNLIKIQGFSSYLVGMGIVMM
jgi:hypothetical protein